MYRDVAPSVAHEAAASAGHGPGAMVVQTGLASAAPDNVSLVQTATLRLEPAGVLLANFTVCHSCGAPASNTREKNVPVVAYGDCRTQSTTTLPLKTL